MTEAPEATGKCIHPAEAEALEATGNRIYPEEAEALEAFIDSLRSLKATS